jgi:hypothetical protein
MLYTNDSDMDKKLMHPKFKVTQLFHVVLNKSVSDEDLETGDIVEIEFYSISEAYHDFLFKLLLQTGSAGGPFQAQPATVRGNIVNLDDFDDFPFGYFSLSTLEKVNVIVE